ncbi:hypothetical protein Hamer_G000713 [Homarus americanus]|uniref:Condensation domain-containing protein n=1 Tax=Homarus americanus TaxID=6706 RepID=A0A8J5TEL2_HOMAM|nr:hypothetical protein Hamer_G000713 [Homarus americanus]
MFTIMRPAVRVWGVASSTPPSTRRSFYLARTLGSYNSIPSFAPTSTSLSSVDVRELSEKARWLGPLNLNSHLYFEAHKVGAKHSGIVNNISTARPIHHQNMVDTLLHLCKPKEATSHIIDLNEQERTPRQSLMKITVSGQTYAPLCQLSPPELFEMMNVRFTSTHKCEKYWYTLKIPILRVNIKPRGGQPWYYEDEHINLDFQVLEEGANPSEEFQKLSKEGLGTEDAPLMKVRMIPGVTDASCAFPEYNKDFPHQYAIIFFVHHSIMDGTSMAYSLRGFVEVLDRVLRGQSVDNTKQIGVFVSHQEITEKELLIEKMLNNDQGRLRELKQEVLASTKSPEILKGYPAPGGPNPTTHFLHREIQPERFHKIYLRCKQHGVTFYTALQAAVNTAIVELLKEAGIHDEDFNISVSNNTNLRRYMARRPSPILGVHVYHTTQLVNVSRNVRESFWNFAKIIGSDLKTLLTSEASLVQSVVRRMTLPPIDPTTYFRTPPPLTSDYLFTNMGDVSAMIGGDTHSVRVTGIYNVSEIHNASVMCFHSTHTFRGKPLYTFTYASNYMTHDTAERLVNMIFTILDEVSE